MTDSIITNDSVFAEAVRKIAPRHWDIWTKIVEGAQAQAAIAIREREEMAAELAKIKQKKNRFFNDEIEAEVAKAEAHHGPAFATLHEAYAVILEELDEVWDITRQKYKYRNAAALRKEFIQLAAMAIRALRSMDNFTGGKI